MSNVNLKKAEIKKTRDRYCNVSVATGVAAIVGIVFSPSILLTAGLTAVGGGVGYFSLKKIKKLNEDEKKLDLGK